MNKGHLRENTDIHNHQSNQSHYGVEDINININKRRQYNATNVIRNGPAYNISNVALSCLWSQVAITVVGSWKCTFEIRFSIYPEFPFQRKMAVVHYPPNIRNMRSVKKCSELDWTENISLCLQSRGVVEARDCQAITWPALINHNSSALICLAGPQQGKTSGEIF